MTKSKNRYWIISGYVSEFYDGCDDMINQGYRPCGGVIIEKKQKYLNVMPEIYYTQAFWKKRGTK